MSAVACLMLRWFEAALASNSSVWKYISKETVTGAVPIVVERLATVPLKDHAALAFLVGHLTRHQETAVVRSWVDQWIRDDKSVEILARALVRLAGDNNGQFGSDLYKFLAAVDTPKLLALVNPSKLVERLKQLRDLEVEGDEGGSLKDQVEGILKQHEGDAAFDDDAESSGPTAPS